MALWQKGDFLTFYCTGKSGPYYLGDYLHPDPRCVDEYLSRGYTDIWLSVSIDNFVATHDLLLRPGEFRDWVSRLPGLRVTPMISCPNDWDKACDRNAKFPQDVANFARGVDDLVSAYALGVEVWEWINQPRLHETMTALRAVTNKPIIIHFNQDDPGNTLVWKHARSLGGVWALSLQYNHSHGRPFATEMAEIERRTPEVVAYAKSQGIIFLAGEYAFEVPEEQARALGKRAVELGAQGCWNGC